MIAQTSVGAKRVTRTEKPDPLIQEIKNNDMPHLPGIKWGMWILNRLFLVVDKKYMKRRTLSFPDVGDSLPYGNLNNPPAAGH